MTYSFSCNLLESRKRKPFFTGTETLYLVEQFEKHKDILTAKFCSTDTNRRKNNIWSEITVGLHLRNPGVKRTVREVKKKWKNIVSMAKKEAVKAAEHTNDSTPNTRISEISQRVLDLFAYLPALQNLQVLENGHEDISEMRGYYGEGESSSGGGVVGSYGANSDLFTLIRNDTRPTSPSDGSELSTDGVDDQRPSSFGDGSHGVTTTNVAAAALTNYRPEIEMVDLIKCETRSTSPSAASDNSNDCPLIDENKREKNDSQQVDVPLNLPTLDRQSNHLVTSPGTTSVRQNNAEHSDNLPGLPVPVSLSSIPVEDKLEIVSINSIAQSLSSPIVDDINIVSTVSAGQQDGGYEVPKNEISKTLPVTQVAPEDDGTSPERKVDQLSDISHTTAASMALTALYQSSMFTNNSSGSGHLLGSSSSSSLLSSKSHRQCLEELAESHDEAPSSHKKLRSLSPDYIELHHSVLLLEKEKLRIEIEKMKQEMVNQEKISKVLDIAKDVFVSLREKL